MNEVFESLDAVLADAVARLEQAARDRRSAMHVPVVGTADGDVFFDRRGERAVSTQEIEFDPQVPPFRGRRGLGDEQEWKEPSGEQQQGGGARHRLQDTSPVNPPGKG